MNKKNKSAKCLQNSYTAFLAGDPDLAIRSLNITFNHATNSDWTDFDVQRILRFSSWLYFYEGRHDKVAALLEEALNHYRRSSRSDKKLLSYLYYNLAECYRRQSKSELCKINFLSALDLLEATVGIDHQSFILVKQRYLEVCGNKTSNLDLSTDFHDTPSSFSQPPAKDSSKNRNLCLHAVASL
jgi:tetratricopeptide (TPR) repeat protein